LRRDDHLERRSELKALQRVASVRIVGLDDEFDIQFFRWIIAALGSKLT
jgi:hypothetical protein